MNHVSCKKPVAPKDVCDEGVLPPPCGPPGGRRLLCDVAAGHGHLPLQLRPGAGADPVQLHLYFHAECMLARYQCILERKQWTCTGGAAENPKAAAAYLAAGRE